MIIKISIVINLFLLSTSKTIMLINVLLERNKKLCDRLQNKV